MVLPIVTPQPVFFHTSGINNVNVRKLGAYSTNPIKMTKKGPLSDIPIHDGEILEDVKQIDTTVYEIEVSDENGKTSVYTLVVPD
jgi:protein-tyrosine phosphatase